jgi:hypothetical protein
MPLTDIYPQPPHMAPNWSIQTTIAEGETTIESAQAVTEDKINSEQVV